MSIKTGNAQRDKNRYNNNANENIMMIIMTATIPTRNQRRQKGKQTTMASNTKRRAKDSRRKMRAVDKDVGKSKQRK